MLGLLCPMVLFNGLTTPLAAYEVSLQAGTDADLTGLLEGGSLVIEQASEEEPLTPQEIIATAQADYKRLLAVLYDQGYYGPTIRISVDGREAATLDPVRPPGAVNRIVVTVDPGKKFQFGRAEVRPLAPDTTLPEGFQTKEVARLSLMRQAANAGITGWRNQGHAKAELKDQKITANHGEGQINAEIVLNPGPKLTFGPLNVTGNEAVRTERILEIPGLPEGQVFSPKELEDAAERLRRTGTFSSVAMIESQTVNAGNTLPITAQISENKPRRFGFGAELATIEGLTLSGFWLHRNFFGGAESLRFDAEIAGIGGDTGGIDYLLGTRYERPATFNEDTTLFALAEVEQLDQVNFFSRRVSIGAGIQRFASDQRTYTFGLGFRRATTRDVFGDSDYTLFILQGGLEFDYRDVELDARKGYYINAEFSPFLALSGSDNGLLTEVDYRKYFTFGEQQRTTLAFRGQLGSVIGPSLADAPADFLFYSGGGGTVRGHDYQSLGVDVGLDELAGGRSFVGLSAELRFRTEGSLGYVGFFDAGYIGEEELPDGSGEWHSGAGIGIRYDTGIGPIRVDLAVPVTGDNSDSNFQIYIGIGQSF